MAYLILSLQRLSHIIAESAVAAIAHFISLINNQKPNTTIDVGLR